MATAPLDVDVPDIQPDFSAPFFAGFQVIASYILAGAMLVVLIMLIIAAASLAFRGLASDRMRTWAGENILWIFVPLGQPPAHHGRRRRARHLQLRRPAGTVPG